MPIGPGWRWRFVVAQGPIVTDAISMMAAVTEPIPMKPTVMVQSAILFIQLAVGGAAGRLTTNVVYLRRFGVDTTDAVTQAGINTLAQFSIQVVILLLGLAFSDLDWGSPSRATPAGALIVGLILLPSLCVGRAVREADPRPGRAPDRPGHSGDSGRLAKDPSRLLTLLGRQPGLAGPLRPGVLVHPAGVRRDHLAGGGPVINTAAALLGGLVPVPGGVGVTEAILTAGLVAAGVDQATAFAAAVTYRVLYAYLPPVWGWFALRWLAEQGIPVSRTALSASLRSWSWHLPDAANCRTWPRPAGGWTPSGKPGW